MKLAQLIHHQVLKTPLPSLQTGEKCIINTINPHSYCEAKRDDAFYEALLSSDVLVPDGFGIVLAVKILTHKTIKKIAGSDIHKVILERAHADRKSVFYLGSSVETLALIKERVKKEFSGVRIGVYSPPYKSQFSDADTSAMLTAVNTFQPDYLFVGLTAPKQEKWIYANKGALEVPVIATIGAVFDFYAGTKKRSSPFWIDLGLEWLPRLMREPKRLWKRNFVSTPLFLWDLLKAKIL